MDGLFGNGHCDKWMFLLKISRLRLWHALCYIYRRRIKRNEQDEQRKQLNGQEPF